jgi:choline dehydrogenase-like flavoprotein
VHGYEGLYCIDSSIIPTSLGVNPSLTISAVSERCAERLVARAPDLELPKAPPSYRPRVPPEHVGARAVPAVT